LGNSAGLISISFSGVTGADFFLFGGFLVVLWLLGFLVVVASGSGSALASASGSCSVTTIFFGFLSGGAVFGTSFTTTSLSMGGAAGMSLAGSGPAGFTGSGLL